MPYFHATERHRLASILSRGLGGVDLGPRSEDCPRFVYLASHPRLAILIAIMHVLNRCSDEDDPLPGTPAQALDEIVVLVVDDARINRDLLAPDPCVQGWTGSWAYSGVIDVRSAVMLSVDDVLSADSAGLLPPVDDAAWHGFGSRSG